ncbi:MAG TPA: patatin-like phospholipase family protein [Thermoleophilaceae bacterium]
MAESEQGPRRLLALDGGGIRGVLTLEVLAELERTLQSELGRDDSFVLGDWFDYVGGTSTGAIVAAGLAQGMRVAEIQALYRRLGPDMFKKPVLPMRLWALYRWEPLAKELQSVFGADTTFGDRPRRALLMMVLRNATTDSPWPLANNPGAKYNQPGRPGNNLALPLWQLVRASTAAPAFFRPEVITVGDRRFTFVDGGVTAYNNPAFQLFLMATMDAYGLGWPTGEDRLLLVSVGTGTNPNADENLKLSRMHLVYNAKNVPAALMLAAQMQQDVLCRVFGRCLVGGWIDRELEFLHDESGVLREKLFTYLRYNAELSADALRQLGLDDVDANAVSRLDSVDRVDDLARIGRAVARDVDPAHYRPFL